MKADTVQVHWHDKQPVYSVAFHPRHPTLFATAGGDHNIRLWQCHDDPDNHTAIHFKITLSRHAKSVNCVRFSPSGDILASAGDCGTIILWHNLPDGDTIVGNLEQTDNDPLSRWTVKSLLKAADTEDIYDLDFSPCGNYIMVGLTDNSAQIWSIGTNTPKQVKVLKDHKHFVQGVCWDPLDQLVVTQSCDRTVKLWQLKRSTKTISFAAFNKFSKSGSLFQDESCVSFFRRLSFSPDGSLLFLPVGQRNGKPALHVVARCHLNNAVPSFSISCFEKPVIAVKCSPIYYERCHNDRGLLSLPYRMIIAVMTMDSVFIFDTESKEPIWSVTGLHYGTLTDLSWSCDGRRIMVTSTDGFCSLIELEEHDLLSHPLAEQPRKVPIVQDVPSSEPDLLPARNNRINQLIPKKRSLLSEEAI